MAHLLRKKNTSKMIINHKGTRMVKQTTNSKNLGLLTFRDAQIVTDCFAVQIQVVLTMTIFS